jgi:stage II sporulation protein D (peptidoglycan lytic transglycosylase)
MISSSSIARQQFNKLGILLLICVSLHAAIPGREKSHSVTVAVFGLFLPERVDITTPHNAVVSIQSGSAEVKRVLGSGQRLQVECRGELLEVKFFEHDQRMLLTYSADAVRTEETVCTLSVPGRIQRDFSGRLEVVVRQGRLLPRVTVQEEVAIQQILRAEMAGAQELEALKAQAILVRSYLRTATRRHQNDGYDFCDSTHCQFFTDFKTADDRFRQAAITTRGLVLTFLGKSFQPLYTAACGGQTLARFSDTDQTKQGADYPYRSVSCRFCVRHPLFEWETTIAKQELLRALKEESAMDPTKVLASLAEPGETGELGALKQATRIQVGRVLGWNIIRSNRYSIELQSDPVKIKGHGSGHNFGFCQAGAIELSKQGKSMSEILSFYFPGSRIDQ